MDVDIILAPNRKRLIVASETKGCSVIDGLAVPDCSCLAGVKEGGVQKVYLA